MVLTNKTYNILKFIALVFLPGINTAYFGLSQVWGFPNTEKVIGTLVIIDTLLGLLLKNSTTRYRRSGGGDGVTSGDLVVQTDPDDGSTHLGLAINRADMAALGSKDVVTLKVQHQGLPPSQSLLLPKKE